MLALLASTRDGLLTSLPMLPSQILLNSLIYDASQLAIPTDNADPEQLAHSSRWDVHFIRRFMLFFGPISTVFDFAIHTLRQCTGFQPLPGRFYAAPAAMVAVYLVLIEEGKRWFYRAPTATRPRMRLRIPGHRVHRRAALFTVS